ncbi:MAG: rhodanese-like domain-containing protein, partial [Verrucomicrobia bacterium]
RRPAWPYVTDSVPSIEQVGLAEVRAAYANALWIDAREPAAYAAAHVPGALALNEADWDAGFSALVDRWDGAQPIVVYCGGESCQASETVAQRLKQELAFPQIIVLRGGWDAWLAAKGEGP